MSKYALVRKKAVMQTLICLIISENKLKKVRGNMGNSNSGRYGGKLKREQCISLNIKILNRKKVLFHGTSFSVSWTNGNEISVNIKNDVMVLTYAAKGSNSCNYPISLAYTPCHFGGQRTWFSCPRCHAKSTRLYLRDYRFACRQCHRLSYQSQSLDNMGRNQWAYQRLQNKLGEHELKPKGMHWKTYNRLINELMERDNQINRAFNIMAMRFTKRYGMNGL